MTAVVEVAFSDLLNKPKDTLASMGHAGVFFVHLRRRDAEDLVLTTASRRAQEHEVVLAATRLLVTVARQAGVRESGGLRSVMLEVFPWARFLPEDDLWSFVDELTETLRAVEDLDNVAPVAQLITEWRHTAEIHADPAVAAVLRQDGDDFGPVSEPGPVA